MSNKLNRTALHVFDLPFSKGRIVISFHEKLDAPFFGATRVIDLDDDISAKIEALRLCAAMEQKIAIHRLPINAAKCVVDCSLDEKPKALDYLAQLLQRWNKPFFTGQDLNISDEDLLRLSRQYSKILGCPDAPYQPAAITADGVYGCLTSAWQAIGTKPLREAKILVMGAGQVGSRVIQRIKDDGGAPCLIELDEERLRSTGCKDFREDVAEFDGDIFVPCGRGDVLTEDFCRKTKVKLIVGAANNQLSHKRNAQILLDRHVTYVPDFVANSAGVLAVYHESLRSPKEEVDKGINDLGSFTRQIIDFSLHQKMTTPAAFDILIQDRLPVET